MTIEEAFWGRVQKDGPVHSVWGQCWRWTGTRNQSGRGQFIYKGKWYSAPRTAHKLLRGPIAKGKWVFHHCDNPECTNPKHLFTGTQTDNMQDMEAKGRGRHPKGVENARCKVTPGIVAEMRRRHKRWCPVNGTKAMAIEFGLSADRVQRIVNGYDWSEGITF